MDQRRVCIQKAMSLGFALLFLMLLRAELAQTRTYLVGGSLGWTFGASALWSGKKSLQIGDVLDFRYNNLTHNVVVVDAESYAMCRAPTGARIYMSGRELLTLVSGLNYFICDFPGHCEAGMKLAVNAI